MKKSWSTANLFIAFTLATLTPAAFSQAANLQDQAAVLVVHADRSGPMIHREIFGQFAEMLGEGVYGGIWVGRDSSIPNVRGIRKDVVKALRDIKVPVVRWPGGCYADEYHWRDGIGPAKLRPKTLNANWGGVVDPNTFGTDEFMDLVEQIGSQAYLSVNVGSGTPEEAEKWLEYLTTDQATELGEQRARNGHPKPYTVQYLGLGNESWGCGGAMSADEYVSRMKLFSHFSHNDNPAQASASIPDILKALSSGKFDMSILEPGKSGMQQVAVGPDAAKTEYTEAVMKAWSKREPTYWGIQGLSLHNYTTGGGFPFSFASTDFGEKEYAAILKETLRMNTILNMHSAIMDRYDPKKKVSLVVDEWGVWLKTLPGTNPLFLHQQNSLRDALAASLSLNIFARHADRVRMTNIAQMVNVIQSMVLTDKEKMLLTPTYYVYKMYVPFQDAQSVPVDLQTGSYTFGSVSMPRVDALAAKDTGGVLWLALTNADPSSEAEVKLSISGTNGGRLKGQVLTAAKVDSINTFQAPDTVRPQPYEAPVAGDTAELKLPPKSVVVLRVE